MNWNKALFPTFGRPFPNYVRLPIAFPVAFSCNFFRKFFGVSGLFCIFADGTPKIIIMSKQTITQLIADYFKTQPVLKAWLFGSFARGEETPDSDIDILVEYDQNARISLLTISHMMGELERSTGRRVDLIEEGCLLPFAVESANRDKQLIYERRD